MYHFEEQSPNVLALPGNQGKKISPWTGCYGFDDLTNLGEINLAYDPYFTHLSGDKKLGYGIVGVKSPEIPIWEGFINFFRIILIVLLSCMLVFFLSNKAETHPTHDSHVHTEHTIVDKAELHIITPITNTVTNTLGINEPSTETSETVRLTVPAGTNDRKVKVCFTGNAKHGMDYEIYYPNKITPTDGCIVLTVAGGDVSEDFNIKILNNPAATDMIRKVYMTMEDVDTTTPELNNINVHIAISDRDITTVVPSVTPTVSITGVSPVNESGTAIFTLTASTAPTTDISVNVNVADSGNFAGSDQTGIKTVTIAANSATKTLEVELVDDSNDEPDGTITATVQSGPGYTEGNPSSASIIVQDNDDPPSNTPTVRISGASPVNESGTATFTLTASTAPTGGSITVNVNVVDSGDFVGSGQTGAKTVTIADGMSTGTLEVALVDDSNDEPDGTITATIQPGSGYAVGNLSSASITVQDNDDPPPNNLPPVTPTVRISGASPVDESGTATFTLTASTAPTTDISVNVDVAEDSGNFAGSSQTGRRTVTIAAGTSTGTLEVALVDDSNDEPDGTITATVQSGSGYTEGNPSSASIAVQDNDDLQIVFNQKALVVMEGSSETYTVKLTSKPSSQMNIGIRIHPEGDVTVTPEQVSFGPSDWNTEKTISITADEDEDKVSEKIQLIHTFDVRTDTVQVTVRDNDIPPSESVGVGLVRFGRTVGEQSVSAIAERISASRYPNFKGMLAGQTLSAVRCDNNMVKKPGTLDSLKQQHSCLGNESQWSDSVEFPPPSTQTRPLSEEEIVAGTSFALTREIDTGDLVTIWGQGARSGFSGKDKTYSVKGYVTGFQLGVDWSHYNQLYGVMLSRSNGDIQYWNDDKTEGDIDFGLTAVVPYMGWRVNDDYMIWGGLGFGNGDLTRLEVNADEIKADLSWRMAALGTEGTLPEIQALAGAELSWSTDVLWTQTRSDGVENSLDPLSGKTLRRRMGFKSTWERIIASGSILRPSLEVALRNDSGDAETGLGLQAGGGLEWIDSKRGLSLRLRGQKLIMHEKDEFKNWGVSISLIYDPAPETKEGFAANLSHNVGEPPLESSKLLQAESIPKIEDINEEKSWSAEMAYGVSQGNGKVGSSYMAVNGGSEAETARLGYRIEPDLDYAQNMMVDVWTEPEVGSSEKSRETGSSVGINLVSRW